jgi:hypothetical protein
MTKLEAWIEKAKQLNKEYCEPNSTVDSGNLFNNTIEAIAVIEELKEDLEKAIKYLREGKAKFAPHTSNSFVDDLLVKYSKGSK